MVKRIINENVGIAHIVVTNKNGVYIDRDNLFHNFKFFGIDTTTQML